EKQAAPVFRGTLTLRIFRRLVGEITFSPSAEPSRRRLHRAQAVIFRFGVGESRLCPPPPQFLATRGRELQAFFEELQRLLKRYIAFLELVYDLFQALKAIFKFGHRAGTPYAILLPEGNTTLDFLRNFS